MNKFVEVVHSFLKLTFCVFFSLGCATSSFSMARKVLEVKVERNQGGQMGYFVAYFNVFRLFLGLVDYGFFLVSFKSLFFFKNVSGYFDADFMYTLWLFYLKVELLLSASQNLVSLQGSGEREGGTVLVFK